MQWHSLPALGRVLWSCNTWEEKQLCQALNHRRHKPPQCITSCRLDFDTSLSSIATLAQLPLLSYPHSPHSRLPSTDPPYFTLASLHFLSFPFCTPHLSLLPTPPSFPSLPTHIICPYRCYIGQYCTISSYTGFATCDNIQLSRMTRIMRYHRRHLTYLLADWSCYMTLSPLRPITSHLRTW